MTDAVNSAPADGGDGQRIDDGSIARDLAIAFILNLAPFLNLFRPPSSPDAPQPQESGWRITAEKLSVDWTFPGGNRNVLEFEFGTARWYLVRGYAKHGPGSSIGGRGLAELGAALMDETPGAFAADLQAIVGPD